jgi:glucose/arabinose dehydrogenase
MTGKTYRLELFERQGPAVRNVAPACFEWQFDKFANGRPAGPPRDILSGFLAPDERESYGRPVGVTLGPDGSLLMADDVGDVIWRVTGA